MNHNRLVVSLVILILLVLPGLSSAQTSPAFPVPPGRLLAGDDNGLFTMLADGSEKTYLVQESEPDCWMRDGAWRSDAQQIIYTAICGGSSPNDWRPDPNRTDLRTRTASVFLYDVAAQSHEPLIPPDGDYQDYAGTWMPDGKQVIIYSDRDASNTFNLYTFDLASGELAQLTSLDTNISHVSVDPTGHYLLYNRRIVEGNTVRFEIRALDLTNMAEIRVAPGVTPAWSPDGKWLAYATDTGEADIYILPTDCLARGGGCSPETDAHNLTYTPDIVEREPIFSPDQTQIVYVRDTDSNPATFTWDIVRQEIRTGRLQNLTNTPDVEERHSAWEPVTGVTPVAVESVLPVVVRVSTTEGAANLRADASTNGTLVGTVSSGQLLFVQGVTDNKSWYRVTLPADGTEAWIYNSLIIPVVGDLASVPVVPAQ